MSSDSEEDYDLTGSLVGNKFSDFEDSDSESSGDYEVQDEILSDSDSDSKENKRKENNFPRMELGSEDEDDILQSFSAPKTKKSSNGTFAGLGLSSGLVKNVLKRGFKNPTPIQRKTIPLILEGRDVVGMARTGSGKTAAFVLPMLERLKVHSAKVGARALLLSPNRELALQTVKIVREFSKGTDLRSVVLVGGDSLEEQFGYMMSNPDIIIATPGRFMHLKVEMQLDLKTIEYVVFDEADRLFEQGFSDQLNEVLLALNPSRQTLLFSATLPKSLVDFAKAGLTDPTLVRLDVEAKISDDLEMAYFAIKDQERDAGLCLVLQDIIKMPLASDDQKKYLESRETLMDDDNDEVEDEDEDNTSTKRRKKSKLKKRVKEASANELPTKESTIIFAPTKHHVEYISNMLISLGYAVSYIYGTLDQAARREQLHRFRAGKTGIMVVTDVAARGIDIPVLANVINYTLPSSPKVFVHRVGRTARAGRRGWAYSLVKESEVPYLLDLEIFLGRKLLLTNMTHLPKDKISFSQRIVLGGLPRDELEIQMEQVDGILNQNYDLRNLKTVASRAEKMYLKSRQAASPSNVKRAKKVISDGWDKRHLLLGPSLETARQELLEKFANRKNKQTVFELQKTSFAEAAELMGRRRVQIAPIQQRALEKKLIEQKERDAGLGHDVEDEVFGQGNDDDHSLMSTKSDSVQADESDIINAFKNIDNGQSITTKRKGNTWKDPNFFISHYNTSGAMEEKGYSIDGGKSFAGAAQGASFEINGEGTDFHSKQIVRWDKKKGKYVNTMNQDGLGKKFIRGEGGTKIAASFRSGKFDAWKAQHKTESLKVGNFESSSANSDIQQINTFQKFKHKKVQAPKAADKARDDYKIRKKRVDEALDKGLSVKGMQSRVTSNGLHSTDEIRKQRKLKEKRREKNARPSKRRK